MPMYTRCPFCRSEISFEPPANLATLPDDYKYPIKCPCCGVLIGVKLNKIDREATYPNSYAPRPTEFNDVNSADRAEAAFDAQPVAQKSGKRPGTTRNILMMILSLLFVGLFVVGYLAEKGIINFGSYSAFGFTYFSAIGDFEMMIKDFGAFKAAVVASYGASLIPILLFVFAGVDFIVAFISACGKKYSRAFNLVWSILVFLLSVGMLFVGYLAEAHPAETDMIGYIQDLASEYCVVLVAGVVIGLVQFICSLCYLKTLERKPE